MGPRANIPSHLKLGCISTRSQSLKSDFDLLEDKYLTIQHKFLKSEITEIDFYRDDSLRTPMILLPSKTSKNYFLKEQHSKNHPKGIQQVKKHML